MVFLRCGGAGVRCVAGVCRVLRGGAGRGLDLLGYAPRSQRWAQLWEAYAATPARTACASTALGCLVSYTPLAAGRLSAHPRASGPAHRSYSMLRAGSEPPIVRTGISFKILYASDRGISSSASMGFHGMLL